MRTELPCLVRPTVFRLIRFTPWNIPDEVEGKFIDCALEALQARRGNPRSVVRAEFRCLNSGVWVEVNPRELREAIARSVGGAQ